MHYSKVAGLLYGPEKEISQPYIKWCHLRTNMVRKVIRKVVHKPLRTTEVRKMIHKVIRYPIHKPIHRPIRYPIHKVIPYLDID